MSKKTYNYPTPEYWKGGHSPAGDCGPEDINKYLKSWDEFIVKIEKLTGMTVTGFDPGVDLSTYDSNGKPVMGCYVQLPLWFAKILVYGKPEEKKPATVKRAIKKEPDKELDKVYCRQEVGCTCPECLGFIPGMG